MTPTPVSETAAVNALPGSVVGAPRRWLRLEGVAALGLAIAGWDAMDGSWAVFAAAFFAPDLALLAYRAGPRVGAALYNAAHSYVLPVMLGLAGTVTGTPPLVLAGLVWAAHVGFDRALGYGLKYPGAFADTHLGRIGRPRSA